MRREKPSEQFFGVFPLLLDTQSGLCKGLFVSDVMGAARGELQPKPVFVELMGFQKGFRKSLLRNLH